MKLEFRKSYSYGNMIEFILIFTDLDGMTETVSREFVDKRNEKEFEKYCAEKMFYVLKNRVLNKI